jgi:predicted nucleic acid-binding protein
MIVVDVNIVVYLLTDMPRHGLARQLYQRNSIWVLLPLWRHELLNVLATLTRQEVLERDAAFQVWHRALGLFSHRERQPDMEQALSLSIEQGISSYDAQYVVLARELDILLVSEDKKLQRILPNHVISLAQAATDYQDNAE